MRAYVRPRRVKIVYFSGTGGTMRAARCLGQSFGAHGASVEEIELTAAQRNLGGEADLLILVYPVYAFNAPQAVYDYIHGLPVADRIPAAVISVSGGGEVSPNTACRRGVSRRLGDKGYETVYEAMLVMPANVLMETPEEIAFALLRALPKKAAKIASEIMERQRVVRPQSHSWDRALAVATGLEKVGGRYFGSKMKVSTDCNGCGRCAKDCPSANIRMAANTPVFGRHCQICMRCIYRCPRQALSFPVVKGFQVKSGYDLDGIEQRMAAKPCSAPSLSALPRGYAWSGVRKYLLEAEEL